MRKCFILMAALLAGCAGAQRQVYNHYQQAISAEQAAWEASKVAAEQKCGVYNDDNPLPPKEAVKYIDCATEVIQSLVLPVAVMPELLNQYIAERKKSYLAYKKGEIDRDEMKIYSDEAWANYTSAINQQYQQTMSQAYQADMISGQQRQQALQNFQNQLAIDRQMRAQHSQQLINSIYRRPTNTNCYAYGNNLNCTTY